MFECVDVIMYELMNEEYAEDELILLAASMALIFFISHGYLL